MGVTTYGCWLIERGLCKEQAIGNWYLIQYAWKIHLSQNQQHLDDEDSYRGEGEWVVVNNCRQSRVAHFNQALSLQHDSRSVSNLISSHYRHPPHQPRFIRSPSSHLSLPEARPKFIGSVECTATAAPPPTPPPHKLYSAQSASINSHSLSLALILKSKGAPMCLKVENMHFAKDHSCWACPSKLHSNGGNLTWF